MVVVFHLAGLQCCNGVLMGLVGSVVSAIEIRRFPANVVGKTILVELFRCKCVLLTHNGG